MLDLQPIQQRRLDLPSGGGTADIVQISFAVEGFDENIEPVAIGRITKIRETRFCDELVDDAIDVHDCAHCFGLRSRPSAASTSASPYIRREMGVRSAIGCTVMPPSTPMT